MANKSYNKPILPETGFSFLAAALASVESEVQAQTQELFGDSEYCSDQEFDIIFDSGLTHAEKVTALKALRRRTLVGIVN